MIDVICPVYFLDKKLFNANFESWIKELPVHRVLVGLNNPSHEKYLSKYNKITLIKQYRYKTLGYCLKDLMDRVETEWFAYVHADVRITPYAYEIMKKYVKPNVGIIESHREHWRGKITRNQNGEVLPQHEASDYIYRKRAFSGFQIFQKKAIQSLIDRIEDDYIYRNEDILFQNECLLNGFKYVKTWAMHVHQNINTQWTENWEASHVKQYRGFVKYSDPNENTCIPCLAAIKGLKYRCKTHINSILEFCFMKNVKWAEKIAEAWASM